MRTGIRIIILTVMLALAVTMATFTIAGFTNRESAARASSAYLLAESEGKVAIFAGNDRTAPLRVTNIALSTLRQSDRELISAGLPVETEEELALLLEDLGS